MFNRDYLFANNLFTVFNNYDFGYSRADSYVTGLGYFICGSRSKQFILPEKIIVDIKGKVFKWNSSPKVWRFLVHYSHISNIVFKHDLFFYRKRGKNMCILFSRKRIYLFLLKKTFDVIRQSDLFTGRGVKYTPRKYFKKQGKISTYI